MEAYQRRFLCRRKRIKKAASDDKESGAGGIQRPGVAEVEAGSTGDRGRRQIKDRGREGDRKETGMERDKKWQGKGTNKKQSDRERTG